MNGRAGELQIPRVAGLARDDKFVAGPQDVNRAASTPNRCNDFLTASVRHRHGDGTGAC